MTLPLQPPSEGFKAIALAAGSRQEVFITTGLSKSGLEQLFKEAGAAVLGGDTQVRDGISDYGILLLLLKR